MKKTKLNVQLLRRVQKELLKHPTQFRMETWSSDLDSRNKPAGGCGTAACIGGFAVALGRKWEDLRPLNNQGYWQREAGALLHISPDSPLFYLYQWPREFRFNYHYARTAKQAAKAAVKRIDHFIKTGE